MLKLGVACVIALMLAGCVTAQEREAQAARNIDMQDDAYCRQQVAKLPNADAAYSQCRQRLLQARQIDAQKAQASAAAVSNFGRSLQQAGAALQAASPPPPQPTNCTSMPWAGGVKTTCQ